MNALTTFRGKRSDSGFWITGCYYYSSNNKKHFIIRIGISLLRVEYIEIIPETLGIYTGLNDVNGKPIFASFEIDGKMTKGGDIVKCNLATEPEENGFLCLFKDYKLFFSNMNYLDDDDFGTDDYHYITQKTEIIGNQFEVSNDKS